MMWKWLQRHIPNTIPPEEILDRMASSSEILADAQQSAGQLDKERDKLAHVRERNDLAARFEWALGYRGDKGVTH